LRESVGLEFCEFCGDRGVGSELAHNDHCVFERLGFLTRNGENDFELVENRVQASAEDSSELFVVNRLSEELEFVCALL
jgi:hypothetical protein